MAIRPPNRGGRPRRNRRPLTRSPEDELLFQAGRLFSEKGFAGTSTRDIAEAAGLQQSSVFHYFPTKEAILVALSERALVAPLFKLEAIAAEPGTPGVKLYRVVYAHVQHLYSRPADLLAVLFSPAELPRTRFRKYAGDLDRYTRGIAGIVAEGTKIGEFVECDPMLATMRILGMCHDWTLRWYRKTGTLTEAQIAGDFAQSALRSVLADTARVAEVADVAGKLESFPSGRALDA